MMTAVLRELLDQRIGLFACDEDMMLDMRELLATIENGASEIISDAQEWDAESSNARREGMDRYLALGGKLGRPARGTEPIEGDTLGE